ncbi:hypothetical protein IKA92_02065 [bacterium]|nr:hypothetical protein [bacterium]
MSKIQKIQQNNQNINFKGWKVGKTGEAVFDYIGRKIDTPQQRLAIGSSALILHPLIDLTNNKVDKKTRETAASRSIARAIIGTVTGLIVRMSCIKFGDVVVAKRNKFFNIDALATATEKNLKNYSSMIGNILALMIMLVTNFTVDMPLINKYQDIINEKVFKNKPEAPQGGANG